MRLDRTNRGRTQHIDHIAGECFTGFDVACGSQTAALNNLGLLLIGGDEFIRAAKRAFEQTGLFNHLRPIGGIHGELVVRSLAVIAISEVTFDHARTKSHRAKNRSDSMRVVRQTKDHIWVHGCKGLERIQVQVIVIIGAGCVIGIALHQA